ncbi:MAG: sodium:proton exchanger [Desulfobacterales bacterium S3730MH5]|nr:MAG: sodium:proton exchanger [Desulfobacterales bacterium S3730MH5]
MVDSVLFLFVLGFVLLIKGADFLTDGASAVAEKLRVSELVIGLTVVSFGTSLPEFMVNIIASRQGNSGVAIGNILGSNIANILLILGISAIISPIIIRNRTVWVEIPLSLLALLMLGALGNDTLLYGASSSVLTKNDGMVLLSFFAVFMLYIFVIAKEKRKDEHLETRQIKTWSAIFMILGGSAALFLGGKWVLDGAVHLARTLGMRECVVGLTIVALGTSLPELTTCAVASFKNKSDISIGNVVGSNIFNVFWVLGCSSIVRPIPFQKAYNSDLGFTILVSLLLFVTMFIGKSKILHRREGILFLFLYCSYMTFSFIKC